MLHPPDWSTATNTALHSPARGPEPSEWRERGSEFVVAEARRNESETARNEHSDGAQGPEPQPGSQGVLGRTPDKHRDSAPCRTGPLFPPGRLAGLRYPAGVADLVGSNLSDLGVKTLRVHRGRNCTEAIVQVRAGAGLLEAHLLETRHQVEIRLSGELDPALLGRIAEALAAGGHSVETPEAPDAAPSSPRAPRHGASDPGSRGQGSDPDPEDPETDPPQTRRGQTGLDPGASLRIPRPRAPAAGPLAPHAPRPTQISALSPSRRRSAHGA